MMVVDFLIVGADCCSLFHGVVALLKVLSSEINTAEIRFIFRREVRTCGALRKIRLSPLL